MYRLSYASQIGLGLGIREVALSLGWKDINYHSCFLGCSERPSTSNQSASTNSSCLQNKMNARSEQTECSEPLSFQSLQVALGSSLKKSSKAGDHKKTMDSVDSITSHTLHSVGTGSSSKSSSIASTRRRRYATKTTRADGLAELALSPVWWWSRRRCAFSRFAISKKRRRAVDTQTVSKHCQASHVVHSYGGLAKAQGRQFHGRVIASTHPGKETWP
mmetsp:Transcript_19182/g.52693  ORF Transcript_19182/g.52693 Transcript_19182/m.52693 type:complete len:218 (-) Transcript_19182:2215-2868(-)